MDKANQMDRIGFMAILSNLNLLQIVYVRFDNSRTYGNRWNVGLVWINYIRFRFFLDVKTRVGITWKPITIVLMYILCDRVTLKKMDSIFLKSSYTWPYSFNKVFYKSSFLSHFNIRRDKTIKTFERKYQSSCKNKRH